MVIAQHQRRPLLGGQLIQGDPHLLTLFVFFQLFDGLGGIGRQGLFQCRAIVSVGTGV